MPCICSCLLLLTHPIPHTPHRATPHRATPHHTTPRRASCLQLSHARETLGFDPARYGLTAAEAGEIAYVFSCYDKNEDYRLELSEVKRLW